MNLFKRECPLCNGQGGEIEPVLDYGQGPWYPCQWCDETGEIGIYKYLIAKYEWWGFDWVLWKIKSLFKPEPPKD